ncbi:MAG: DUF971 domain-containing protein [Anaerolineales bacterium]|nr:DUF971 domain-containing protein [Anaerolineales bacterium]
MRPNKVTVHKSTQMMVLEWADGEKRILPFDQLRRHCPCAACKQLDLARSLTPQEIKLVNLNPAGNYALTLAWADGHRHGIYPWALLREIPGALKDARA